MNNTKELIYKTLSIICFAAAGYMSLTERLNDEMFFGIASVLFLLTSLEYRLESRDE